MYSEAPWREFEMQLPRITVVIAVGLIVLASAGATAQPSGSPTVGPPPPPSTTPTPTPSTTPPQQTHGYFGGPSNRTQEKQLQEINRQQPGAAATGQQGTRAAPSNRMNPGQRVIHNRTMNFTNDNSADQLNRQELLRLQAGSPQSREIGDHRPTGTTGGGEIGDHRPMGTTGGVP
jgi:hypothetical protein